MAKDVDLSSREWRDLVFEGKNKEFGAYQLRKNSDGRHNKAMVAVIFVILGIFLISFIVNKIDFSEAKTIDDGSEQLDAYINMAEEQEPEEEVQEEFKQPEPEPVKLPDPVLTTIKASTAVITEEDTEIKTQEELQETTEAFGAADVVGTTDDLNEVHELKEEAVVEEVAVEQVFTAVEQMPQFPGGDAALMAYISKEIRYPAMAQENNIQGRVVIQFVVEKDGSIGEVKVLRGKDPDLDKEAIRVAKSLPRFIPGKMNGQPVRVWFTLPISFKLQM